MIKRITSGGITIQQRLPFFICLLILLVIVTFGWISYVSVKNEALKTGKERLRALTNQVSGMLNRSTDNVLTSTRATADNPLIKKTLLAPDTETRIDALEILNKLRPDTSWIAAELLDANSDPVLRSTRDSIKALSAMDSISHFTLRSNTTGIGKFYLLGSSLYYPINVPVTNNQQLIGHIVRWQKLRTSPQSMESLIQLMGTNSKLYLGNKDGSLWTDMIRPVSYVKIDTNSLNDVFEYSSSNGDKVAVASTVRNTAWLLSIEFPRQSIVETARHFLNRILIIGSMIMIVALIVGWIMSRNISLPLNKLTAATSQIAEGNYSVKVDTDRKDEVGKLARAFNAMIGQVGKAREGLEQKIIETAEVNEQLRALSAYLQKVREDERIHIAREMHDELGQLLTGFKMDVSLLKKRLGEDTDPVVKEKLTYMLSVVDEAVKFVRKIATELRPSILDDLGLIPALEWHSNEFQKRYNIAVDFYSSVQELNTSSLIATGLFRMYQESLTNVARHSHASKVESRLEVLNDEIILSISDNGTGFDTSRTTKNTLGLLGMKERAAMLGGKLQILSAPGKGTIVTISVRQVAGKVAHF